MFLKLVKGTLGASLLPVKCSSFNFRHISYLDQKINHEGFSFFIIISHHQEPCKIKLVSCYINILLPRFGIDMQKISVVFAKPCIHYFFASPNNRPDNKAFLKANLPALEFLSKRKPNL